MLEKPPPVPWHLNLAEGTWISMGVACAYAPTLNSLPLRPNTHSTPPYHPTTAEGTWVSMGVVSDGSYGAPKGVIYSFPCTCKDGKWSIVQVGSGCQPVFFLPNKSYVSLSFPVPARR